MEALIPITFFVCIAAVMILRPVTKQLGKFLEAMTVERTRPAPARETEGENSRTAMLLEHVVRKMDTMEERLDFAERLMARGQQTSPQLSVRDLPDVGFRQEGVHSAIR